MGLEGVAGAGKTTSLTAIREAAEREGYQVVGLAPTSRAAHKLAESGIESHTLQRQLIRNEAPMMDRRRFFVIDESSLASTKQMNEFFHRLHTSTGFFWLAIRGNMRRLKRAGPTSNYRKRGCRRPSWVRLCARRTRL